MQNKKLNKDVENKESDLKLVYSAKKKLIKRSMNCKRAELIQYRFERF